MSQKGLEWAQSLRADLVIRIGGLHSALADMEPLREELRRLQAQLKGVERLIAVYHQLGYAKPALVSDAAALAGEAAELAGSLAGPEQKDPAQDAVRIPSFGYDEPALGTRMRAEVLRAISFCSETAAGAFLTARLWLMKRFLHRSPQP